MKLRTRLFTLFTGLLLVLFGARGPARAAEGETEFIRGDANADGVVSLSDSVMLNRWMFFGRPDEFRPPCLDAADADDTGMVDLTDEIVIFQDLFWIDGWERYVIWDGEVHNVLPEPYPLKGTDPTPDSVTCDSFAVRPAPTTDDVIRVGDVVAAPGETVEIPVYVTNSRPVQAFQLVIGYDPAVLSISPYNGHSGSNPNLSFEGTAYESLHFSTEDGTPFNELRAQPEYGVITVGILGCIGHSDYPIPPGTDVLFVKIIATVVESVPPGTVISLEPTNGPGGQGVGPYRMRNELTCDGAALYASLVPQRVPGRLMIVGDFLDFLRADANGDATVDLSDAISTLGFLYLGEESPACPDAADADDNGALDITDPILTLNYLFQGSGMAGGGASLAASCAQDATSDDLGPCAQAGCP
jgi:hypothetical protein